MILGYEFSNKWVCALLKIFIEGFEGETSKYIAKFNVAFVWRQLNLENIEYRIELSAGWNKMASNSFRFISCDLFEVYCDADCILRFV